MRVLLVNKFFRPGAGSGDLVPAHPTPAPGARARRHRLRHARRRQPAVAVRVILCPAAFVRRGRATRERAAHAVSSVYSPAARRAIARLLDAHPPRRRASPQRLSPAHPVDRRRTRQPADPDRADDARLEDRVPCVHAVHRGRCVPAVPDRERCLRRTSPLRQVIGGCQRDRGHRGGHRPAARLLREGPALHRAEPVRHRRCGAGGCLGGQGGSHPELPARRRAQRDGPRR